MYECSNWQFAVINAHEIGSVLECRCAASMAGMAGALIARGAGPRAVGSDVSGTAFACACVHALYCVFIKVVHFWGAENDRSGGSRQLCWWLVVVEVCGPSWPVGTIRDAVGSCWLVAALVSYSIATKGMLGRFFD